MKEISELSFPDDIRYAESHEWARLEGDTIKVGISDYAQDQLGDIVFVEMPAAGETFEKGAELGTVESVKAVSELYMPIGGEIVSVNPPLEDAPELINESCYERGWICKVQMTNPQDLEGLMSAEAYGQFLSEQS